MSLKVVRALIALLLGSAVWMLAQTAEAPIAPPHVSTKPQFFAGTVTDLTIQHITVSRTPLGRPPEKRTFVINQKTKMNKAALKVRSRVTVRYQHTDETDVALEILLMPRLRTSRPS